MKSFLSAIPFLLFGCTEPETRTSMIVQVEADDPQVLLQLSNQLALVIDPSTPFTNSAGDTITEGVFGQLEFANWIEDDEELDPPQPATLGAFGDTRSGGW